MQIRNPQLIVIVGPTAAGKSELAVKIAKRFGGEVISADSRQIYKGLDIGTGKVPGHWVRRKPANTTLSRSICWFSYKGAPHHCIDFVSPKKTYTVAEYKKCADRAIADITARGKLPILAGGTGFWVDAVVYDLKFPEVPPNQKLRKRLERKSAGELWKILQKLDPQRAKTIEQKNPRRLVRAIEIAKTLGKIPQLKKRASYQVNWIGLRPGDLKERIRRRVQAMVARGLARETKKLLSQGISKKKIQELGFEYRLTLEFLEKKKTKQEMSESLVIETLRYVRRQMTWFKRNKEIRWISTSK